MLTRVARHTALECAFARIGNSSQLSSQWNRTYVMQWGQRTSVSLLNTHRKFSSEKPAAPVLPSSTPLNDTESQSQVLSKIKALLKDCNKFAPASKSMITNGKSLFRRQSDAFFNWYDEISHTNEVREAHKQVEELQDKLNQAQNLRRDVSKELNDIRYELQVCFADQANCPKGDPRYLELIRREIEVRAFLSEAVQVALSVVEFMHLFYPKLDVKQRETKDRRVQLGGQSRTWYIFSNAISCENVPWKREDPYEFGKILVHRGLTGR